MLRQILLTAALLVAPAWSQPVATPSLAGVVAPADRARKVRELVAREFEAQKLVGLSYAIAQNGVIVAEEHFGFENREDAIAAGPQTMYRWASISKPVTAIAAMQTVEAGKLDLDADVRTLVPEFPEKPWTVTPRQLLCHQGGVVHYSNGKVIKSPRPTEPEHPYEDVVLALGMFKESPLVCEPGTKFSYTTHGYMLLGAAAERAAGERFWPLVREKIAKPAGMTTFRPDYQWEVIEHRAIGYRKNKEGEIVRSTDTDVSWKLAGGGFISTVGDLSRFSIALMDNTLVSGEAFTLMRTRQTLKSGERTNYGLGFNIGKLGERPIALHSGGQEKTSTFMLLLPEDKVSVSIMCNTESASLAKLTRAVAGAWIGLLEDATPDDSP